MSPDASWGEIRWQEPQSSSSARESTMATGTLLATSSLLGRDGREDQQRRRLMEPSRRVDHGLHAPHPTLHIGGPLFDPQSNRMLSESRFLSDPVTSSLHGPRNSAITSCPNDVERTRTGSIPKMDYADSVSRRTSGSLPSISGQYRASPPAYNTSLPPIASVQEPLNHDGSHGAAPQTIIKSESPTCRGCIEKKTVIDEIALAVTNLDDLINSHGFRPFKRRSERPQDCSLRTARWVLDRVEDARASLQSSSPSQILDSSTFRRTKIVESPMGRTRSPHGAAKRLTEDTDRDDDYFVKRQRTASYNDSHVDRFRTTGSLEEQRRASDSIQRAEPLRTYSPAHSDSWTSQQRSPNSYGQSLRPLPSPSSLATASQKGGIGGLPGLPDNSPTSIPHGLPPMHTAPTSSATSQHIADLQHQITLKSLALQTLQSEYTSLLQKSQRDRLKTQTLEKKTFTADNEINELTTKNEELAEQVKVLETQLEECERKRETERSDAAREKEQWGKMLEMSGRLQTKSADERQKLLQEKENLQQRLLILENEATLQAKRGKPLTQRATSPSASHDSGNVEMYRKAKEESTQASTKIADLQYENEILQRRTYLLRSVLERMEHQYNAFIEDRRKLMEKEMACIPDVIQMVLREDSAFAKSKDCYSGEGRCDGTQTAGKRRSAEPSPPRTNNQARTLVEIPASGANSEKALLPQSRLINSIQTAETTSSTSLRASQDTPAKKTTHAKLQAVPLPKWQPPSSPAIQTDLIRNNQRRPSGPATPFPKEGSAPRQASEAPHTQASLPGGKTTSPPQAPLPAYGTEKTPALNYTTKYTTPPKAFATATSPEPPNQNPSAAATAAMPPPPRPGSDVDTAPPATASWRPS